MRSRRWIGRGALASLAALIALGIAPALPALAGAWSAPVALPGSCGSSVAENQAGAIAAGGTFQAADGTTHVQLCTSSNGATWQATDLGQGGSLYRPAMAVDPSGRSAAVWGSYTGCPAACAYHLLAAVHPASGSWGNPVVLSTTLNFSRSAPVVGVDGSGDVVAVWSDVLTHDIMDAVLRAGGGWGPAQALSTESMQGEAFAPTLAVSQDGSAVVAFTGGNDAVWAISGTVAGGFSAPAFVAAGDYAKDSAPKVALDDAGQASLAWSRTGKIEAATRSPGGTWSAPAVLAGQAASSVATAIDGAGNAIAVFGSSYSWHLAGGTWGTAAALPAGSSGGLVAADTAGTFGYADSGGNAFTFTAGAASFGAGSGSRGSLGDLKIVPGRAVLLAADTVSTESVT